MASRPSAIGLEDMFLILTVIPHATPPAEPSKDEVCLSGLSLKARESVRQEHKASPVRLIDPDQRDPTHLRKPLSRICTYPEASLNPQARHRRRRAWAHPTLTSPHVCIRDRHPIAEPQMLTCCPARRPVFLSKSTPGVRKSHQYRSPGSTDTRYMLVLLQSLLLERSLIGLEKQKWTDASHRRSRAFPCIPTPRGGQIP